MQNTAGVVALSEALILNYRASLDLEKSNDSLVVADKNCSAMCKAKDVRSLYLSFSKLSTVPNLQVLKGWLVWCSQYKTPSSDTVPIKTQTNRKGTRDVPIFVPAPSVFFVVDKFRNHRVKWMVLYSNDWKSLADIDIGITNRFMLILFTKFTWSQDAIGTVETNLCCSSYSRFLFVPLQRTL